MATRAKKWFRGTMGIVLCVLAYLFFWPLSMDAASWSPPASPSLDEGSFQKNHLLSSVWLLDLGGAGPEDIAIDPGGAIYSGIASGQIMRAAQPGQVPQPFADTGGRPLGLDFDAQGNLIVADAERGLLAVDSAGTVSVLTTEHEGRAFAFADDVDVGRDGRYYFSDASSKRGLELTLEEVVEHRGNGRLLVYDPASAQTTLLLDGLYFANGVAVSADNRFVLVCETTRYRVLRLWLEGPRRGQSEVFIENLPGFPDGISSDGEGGFWLALHSPRSSTFDTLLPRPFWRKVAFRLPALLQPKASRHSFVLGLDEAGQVRKNLQDYGDTSYGPITSIEEHQGWLYLGSVEHAKGARLPVPAE